MTYFPVFMNLYDVPCLVVGGGEVAARKAEKLVAFHAAVTVVAPEISPEFLKMESLQQIKFYKRVFLPEDVANKALVVAATNDNKINREIAKQCHDLNIPVNVVDDQEACTFIFPAIVQRGPILIGISTGGASPKAALYLKERIESMLPENDGCYTEILQYLAQMRPLIKSTVSDQHKRAELFSLLFDLCIEKKRALTDEEWNDLIRKEHEHGAE